VMPSTAAWSCSRRAPAIRLVQLGPFLATAVRVMRVWRLALLSPLIALVAACDPVPADLRALDRCPDIDVSGTTAIVRRVETGMHDVAFRVGCDGKYWIAMLDRGRRTDHEKQIGDVSAVPLTPDWAPRHLTYVGTISDIPYPEAMMSWNLTTQQHELLRERAAFIRLTRRVDVPTP